MINDSVFSELLIITCPEIIPDKVNEADLIIFIAAHQ
jgi:hypothetical protein